MLLHSIFLKSDNEGFFNLVPIVKKHCAEGAVGGAVNSMWACKLDVGVTVIKRLR
jgi:hypothetical protein